jgi:hypothetical protein
MTNQFAYFLKLTKLLDDDRRENSLLVKSMKKLLDTISNNRGKLKHVATWFWDLVETDQKRQLLVQCAIDGFQKAGMFSILAHGRFTLDQLVKRVPNAKSSESLGRLRTDIHRQRTHDIRWAKRVRHLTQGETRKKQGVRWKRKEVAKRRKQSLYIGLSHDIGYRMGGHDHFLPMKRNNHASAQMEADRKYHRVLCDLSHNVYAQQDAHVRLVVEQLLIILLGTFIRDLRTFHKVNASLGEDGEEGKVIRRPPGWMIWTDTSLTWTDL